jgi:hypothetical protein
MLSAPRERERESDPEPRDAISDRIEQRKKTRLDSNRVNSDEARLFV